MLEEDQPNRVYYRQVKKDFGIYDLLVLGIVDEQGVFRPETLAQTVRLVDGILQIKGVVTAECFTGGCGGSDIHTALKGLRSAATAILWFKAHGDESHLKRRLFGSMLGRIAGLVPCAGIAKVAEARKSIQSRQGCLTKPDGKAAVKSFGTRAGADRSQSRALWYSQRKK